MNWHNTKQQWGWVAIGFHWLSTILVFALFALTYYDAWYRTAPHTHKSIGLLLFFLSLVRILWFLKGTKPSPLSNQAPIEHRLATIMHWLLYLLLFALMLSGYLISTADGRAIELFNWIEIPAIISGIDGQEDMAGKIHYILAISLILLVSIHALAAMKHHFFDKDKTLLRMLGKS